MKKVITIVVMLLILGLSAGCQNHSAVLSPKSPVEVIVWHSYEGAQKIAFDNSVREFNSSVGLENGVHVAALDFGNDEGLSEALLESAGGEMDAYTLPDIFVAYSRDAWIMDDMGLLADIEPYFTQEELDGYIDSYLDVGRLLGGGIRILPVAKTTDVGMLNQTEFQRFMQDSGQEAGLTYNDLGSFEGLMRIAEVYYEWTDGLTPDVPEDGSAFYAVHSVEDLMNIISAQMGAENGMVSVSGESPSPGWTEEMLKKIWDFYYAGIIRGYCHADGRASSRLNTGEILYLLTPTYHVTNFPSAIPGETGLEPVELMAVPMPLVEGGEKKTLQLGAGMCVVRSDSRQELASTLFLKWLTGEEQNLNFTAWSTGYMPVTWSAMEQVVAMVADTEGTAFPQVDEKVRRVAGAFVEQYETCEFVFFQPYDQSAAVYRYLSLVAPQATQARQEALAALEEGGLELYRETVEAYCSDEAFREWSEIFSEGLADILRRSVR